MDLSIVIPCYNEVDNVDKLQEEFIPVAKSLASRQTVEVIFVDDGSSDGTLAGLKRAFENNPAVAPLQIRFEQHVVNRGLGAAIRTGLTASKGDVVVTTDSDGTYKFSEIPPLLSCLKDGVDIVTASPYHPLGGIMDVPRYRLILSQGSSFIYRILVAWNVHTYTALFRAYRRRVVDAVPFESNGFLAGTEILVNGMLMGYKVAEYPAVLHSRAAGVSKAKIMRTIRAHLGYQWHVFLCRLNLSPRPQAKQTSNRKETR
jgi:dolichol-phosphate mannosyltransferase